jgi:hypothetical protein
MASENILFELSFPLFWLQLITMRILLSVAVALSAASSVLSQKPARIGPDGKPLLNRPIMEECQKSKAVGGFRRKSQTDQLIIGQLQIC